MAGESGPQKLIIPKKCPMPVRIPSAGSKILKWLSGLPEDTASPRQKRCLDCTNALSCRQGCPVDVVFVPLYQAGGPEGISPGRLKIKETNAAGNLRGGFAPGEPV